MMPIIMKHDDELHPHIHSQRTESQHRMMWRAMAFTRLSKPLKQLGARGMYVPQPGPTARDATVQVWQSKPSTSAAHLRYLEQGKGLNGVDAEVFTMHGQPINQKAFADRVKDDPHQWRMVIAPEGADRLDLKAFTIAYMAQVEKDLGTKLDYAAAVHYDKDRMSPQSRHVHIIFSGLDDRGRPLYFTKEYLSHGLKYRAQTLGTDRLGPAMERPLGPRELSPQEGMLPAQVERRVVSAERQAEHVRSMMDTSVERIAQRTLTRTQVEARMREANTRAQQIRDLTTKGHESKTKTGIER